MGLAILAYAVAVSMHILAVFAALLAFVPLVLGATTAGGRLISWWKLVAFSALATGGADGT